MNNLIQFEVFTNTISDSLQQDKYDKNNSEMIIRNKNNKKK